MSKLIENMLVNLFHNNGKNIDNVILNSIEPTETFDARLTEANCLTSNFMMDIDKSLEDGFLSICEEQDGYNKKLEGSTFEQARALANDFDSKEFKKEFKQATEMEKFQAAIERNLAEFQEEFGNELFESTLAKVADKMPDEDFAVQLVAALTESKINAKQQDIDRIVEIEKSCKPLVYSALRKTKDLKNTKDFQDRIVEYFRRSRNTLAFDYLRKVSISNLIKTKVPNDIYLNTNVSETGKDNSLLTVGGFGYQMYLINANDPDRNKTENDLKITDLIKGSNLFIGNQLSHNSKTIQKAFEKINEKVNEYNIINELNNGQIKPIQDKQNFLQSAIVFMLLSEQAEIQDPLDLIGIAIANPVSDILFMMNEKEDINSLIENSFHIANSISREEKGVSLVENRNIEALEPEVIPESQEEPAEIPQQTPVQPHIEKNYTGTNVRAFYKLLTRKVVEMLSKNLPRMQALEEELAQNGEFTTDLTSRKKLRKDGFTADQKEDMYQALTDLYGSSEDMLKTIDELKSMHSDMDIIAGKLTNQIKKGQDFKLRKKELLQMHLDDEQAKSRLEKYQAYFTFVKSLDPTKRVTLNQILELKKEPSNPLNGILKYFDEPEEEKTTAPEQHDNAVSAENNPVVTEDAQYVQEERE